MKFIYIILTALLMSSNVVCAQSILKGKQMACPGFASNLAMESYIVDANGKATMKLRYAENGNSMEISVNGVDQSSTKLFDFRYDLNTLKVTNIDVEGMVFPGDGSVIINGQRITKDMAVKNLMNNGHSKASADAYWNKLMNASEGAKEMVIKVLPKTFTFQISYMNDEGFLVPGTPKIDGLQYKEFKYVK